MKITSTQKVIKVGSSNAVTIPAKDMKRLGIKTGDSLDIVFQKSKSQPANEHTVELVELTQMLIKRHGQALKNLSQK